MRIQINIPTRPRSPILSLSTVIARTAALLVQVSIVYFAVFIPNVQAADITVHDAQGDVRVPVDPKIVATLDLATLDTLSAIGVDVAGVPTAPYPPYLAKFASSHYQKIGSLFEPDYEAINALGPDLIIVAGRSAPKFRELTKLAPTIDLSPDLQHRVNSAIAHAEILGQIFNKQVAVAQLVHRLQFTLAALQKRTATIGTGLLIMTSGGRLSAIGPDSWFGTLYNDFGVKPAVRTLDHNSAHGQVVSSEFILQTNPDWLFVIDRDAAIGQNGVVAKQLLDNPLVRQTKAWKAGHVVYLNPVTWYIVGDGLTALQQMVDEVAQAVAPPT